MADESQLYLSDAPAGAYLTNARANLLNCGKAARLYPRTTSHDKWPEAAAHLRAEGRQIDFARTSLLFTALAAEAYVNAVLAEALSATDFKGIDRLRTVDKYVLGAHLAFESPLFPRDREPAQSIEELFKLRHRLVHAKRRRLEVDKDTLADPRYKDFNPPAAAKYLVAVAQAALTLAEAGGEEPDAIACSVCENADRFREFGESLAEKLPPAPKLPTANKFRRKTEVGPVPSSVPRSLGGMVEYLGSLAGSSTGPAGPAGTPSPGSAAGPPPQDGPPGPRGLTGPS